MDILNAIFGFGQITFAILFVIPQLITSFKVDINPVEVKNFYRWLGVGYFTISVCGILVLLSNLTEIMTTMQGAFAAVAFLVIIFIGALGWLYARKWTLQEQTNRFLDLNTPRYGQPQGNSELEKNQIDPNRRFRGKIKKQTKIRRSRAGRKSSPHSSK